MHSTIDNIFDTHNNNYLYVNVSINHHMIMHKITITTMRGFLLEINSLLRCQPESGELKICTW
jgi:hypothetical protein